MIITKTMIYFTEELKLSKASNGSCITPITHNEGWVLPVGFVRTLSNEGIEFEKIVITEEVEDPKEN